MPRKLMPLDAFPALQVEPFTRGEPEGYNSYIWHHGLKTRQDLEHIYAGRFRKMFDQIEDKEEAVRKLELNERSLKQLMAGRRTMTIAQVAMVMHLAGYRNYDQFDINQIEQNRDPDLCEALLSLDKISAEQLLLSVLQMKSHMIFSQDNQKRIQYLQKSIRQCIDLNTYQDQWFDLENLTLSGINRYIQQRYIAALQVTHTSQEEIAGRLGMSRSNLRKYMDRNNPDAPHIPLWVIGLTSQAIRIPRMFYSDFRPLEEFAARLLLIRESTTADPVLRQWMMEEARRRIQSPVTTLLETARDRHSAYLSSEPGEKNGG